LTVNLWAKVPLWTAQGGLAEGVNFIREYKQGGRKRLWRASIGVVRRERSLEQRKEIVSSKENHGKRRAKERSKANAKRRGVDAMGREDMEYVCDMIYNKESGGERAQMVG
jgi:hypothetical protein